MTAVANQQQTGQRPARLEQPLQITMDYLRFLPEGYDDSERWPLLLFLHGAGERGRDLERVKRHGPPKIVESQRDFPFIVISPQCPADQFWEPCQLLVLLDEVVARYRVDPQRIYVTGMSMGGFGTWGLALLAPQRFAAIAPVCGGGQPFLAERLVDLPVWAFHGANDPVVPFERSEEMVQALQQIGGNVRFTVYPDTGHDSWTPTYDNPELYRWLLEQTRPADK
jgi:predicted peptidase